jgi:hypothetical protein
MNIYEHFSCFMRLPVRIDSVVDFLKDAGFVTNVGFSEVDIPPEVLWAQVRAYYPKTPYNNDIPPIVDIMYSKYLSENEARLACCKELLHILDEPDERAKSKQEVETLINQMSIPPNAGFSLPAANDHSGVIKALVLLVPRDALEELKPLFEAGDLSEGEMAAAFGVPVEYVRLTLIPQWPDICKLLLGCSKE